MTWRQENDAEEKEDASQTPFHIPKSAFLFHVSAMFHINECGIEF